MNDYPYSESDIVTWKIKFFTINLQENDPTIMGNLPMQYLRKYNFNQILYFLLSVSFKYFDTVGFSYCTVLHYVVQFDIKYLL